MREVRNFVSFGILAVVLVACGTLKNIGRTVNDAGAILCELYAVDSPDSLDGMTAADWCAVHENVRPFIDEALAAKQAAGLRVANPEAAGGQD